MLSALWTKTADFDGLPTDLEPDCCRVIQHPPVDRRVDLFDGHAAAVTDKQLRIVYVARPGAADKCVLRIDLVDEAMGEEKIQCTVNRGWGGLVAFLCELLEYLVGTMWLMALPDQFQHAPADWREPQAICLTILFGIFYRCIDAGVMVMGLRAKASVHHR